RSSTPDRPPPDDGFELENHHAATSNPETATHAGRLARVVVVFVPRRVFRSVVVSVPTIGARRASETCATIDLDTSAAYLIPASARGTAARAAAISSQILEALRLPAPGAPPLRDPAVRRALADRDLHQDELDRLRPVELALAVKAVRVRRSRHHRGPDHDATGSGVVHDRGQPGDDGGRVDRGQVRGEDGTRGDDRRQEGRHEDDDRDLEAPSDRLRRRNQFGITHSSTANRLVPVHWSKPWRL